LIPMLHSRQMPALPASIARAAPIDAGRHHSLPVAIALVLTTIWKQASLGSFHSPASTARLMINRQLMGSNSTTRSHSDLAVDQLCYDVIAGRTDHPNSRRPAFSDQHFQPLPVYNGSGE
jgi:hypothetical protein